MAHSAPPSNPSRRRREIFLGILFLVIAIPLIIVAIVALRHSKGQQASPANPSELNSSASSAAIPPATSPPVTRPVTSPPAHSVVPSSQPSSTAAPSTPAPSAPAPSSPGGTTVRLPLVVLNSSTNSAATAAAVTRFSQGGWSASNDGFFDGKILSTAAYYDPSADGSRAAALALQKQFPAIQRVVPRFSGLPNGPVVVVLTSDYG